MKEKDYVIAVRARGNGKMSDFTLLRSHHGEGIVYACFRPSTKAIERLIEEVRKHGENHVEFYERCLPQDLDVSDETRRTYLIYLRDRSSEHPKEFVFMKELPEGHCGKSTNESFVAVEEIKYRYDRLRPDFGSDNLVIGRVVKYSVGGNETITIPELEKKEEEQEQPKDALAEEE